MKYAINKEELKNRMDDLGIKNFKQLADLAETGYNNLVAHANGELITHSKMRKILYALECSVDDFKNIFTPADFQIRSRL